jgi:hypothetical protein
VVVAAPTMRRSAHAAANDDRGSHHRRAHSGRDGAAGQTIRIGQKAIGTKITLHVVDKLRISLPANPTTGYSWKVVADQNSGCRGRLRYSFTWESGWLGPLSNSAGRALISRQMRDSLTAADEI